MYLLEDTLSWDSNFSNQADHGKTKISSDQLSSNGKKSPSRWAMIHKTVPAKARQLFPLWFPNYSTQQVFGGRANVSLTSQILKLYHCYLAVILAFSNRQENIMICILSSWQMKEKQDRSNVLNDQPNSYGSEVTLLSLGLSFIWPWISDQVEAPLHSMLVHRAAVK